MERFNKTVTGGTECNLGRVQSNWSKKIPTLMLPTMLNERICINERAWIIWTELIKENKASDLLVNVLPFNNTALSAMLSILKFIS